MDKIIRRGLLSHIAEIQAAASTTHCFLVMNCIFSESVALIVYEYVFIHEDVVEAILDHAHTVWLQDNYYLHLSRNTANYSWYSIGIEGVDTTDLCLSKVWDWLLGDEPTGIPKDAHADALRQQILEWRKEKKR